LLVCGFAFDPHVAEEAKRYGKLKVLSVRMNPDLAMGDEVWTSSRMVGAPEDSIIAVQRSNHGTKEVYAGV
jgi:hypothetical protein